jgi:hypothetical protein
VRIWLAYLRAIHDTLVARAGWARKKTHAREREKDTSFSIGHAHTPPTPQFPLTLVLNRRAQVEAGGGRKRDWRWGKAVVEVGGGVDMGDCGGGGRRRCEEGGARSGRLWKRAATITGRWEVGGQRRRLEKTSGPSYVGVQ